MPQSQSYPAASLIGKAKSKTQRVKIRKHRRVSRKGLRLSRNPKSLVPTSSYLWRYWNEDDKDVEWAMSPAIHFSSISTHTVPNCLAIKCESFHWGNLSTHDKISTCWNLRLPSLFPSSKQQFYERQNCIDQ